MNREADLTFCCFLFNFGTVKVRIGSWFFSFDLHVHFFYIIYVMYTVWMLLYCRLCSFRTLFWSRLWARAYINDIWAAIIPRHNALCAEKSARGECCSVYSWKKNSARTHVTHNAVYTYNKVINRVRIILILFFLSSFTFFFFLFKYQHVYVRKTQVFRMLEIMGMNVERIASDRHRWTTGKAFNW